MRKGYSFAELIVYLALLSVFFSILVPALWNFAPDLMFKSDVQDAEHLIKYARQISLLENNKSVFSFEDNKMYVKIGNKIVKERKVRISNVFGKKTFAFSRGIPYESGKIFLSFKDEKACLTLQPVTGTLKIVWE
jgi:hypothetical protein